MKLRIVSLLFLVLIFFGSTPNPPAFAHLRGAPIFTINGEYVKIYPAQEFRSDIFDLPADSDIAPQNYLTGQKLEFNLQTDRLPLPIELIPGTDFLWDFGNGTKQTIKGGTKNSYIYNSPGTYILTVYAEYNAPDSNGTPTPLSQSIILNILPDKNYQLPQALIKVNGIPQKSDGKSLEFDLKDSLTFDASGSKQGTAKIVSYEWDFDDGKRSLKEKTSHKYKLPQYYASPVLRVTDANGFFVDTIVDIRNTGENKDTSKNDFMKIFLLINSAIVVVIVFFVVRAFRKPKSK